MDDSAGNILGETNNVLFFKRALKLGAALDIVSTPGHGTRLTLTLPNEDGSAEV